MPTYSKSQQILRMFLSEHDWAVEGEDQVMKFGNDEELYVPVFNGNGNYAFNGEGNIKWNIISGDEANKRITANPEFELIIYTRTKKREWEKILNKAKQAINTSIVPVTNGYSGDIGGKVVSSKQVFEEQKEEFE